MRKNAEILEELTHLKSTLGNLNVDGIQSFHVPEGYFEHLSIQILENVKASQMETTLNISVEKTELYSVPENYFESFGTNVLQQIKNAQLIIEGKNKSFDDIASVASYQVPTDYFASFEQNLLKKIGLQSENAIEEIEIISPLLAGLRAKSTYKAPETYFNAADFSEKVQGKTIERKVIEHPAVKSIKWARWAAAASIIMIFSIGGFKFLNTTNNISPEAQFQKSLAKIPEAKIREWLSNNIDESDLSSLNARLINAKDLKTKKALENITEEDLDLLY